MPCSTNLVFFNVVLTLKPATSRAIPINKQNGIFHCPVFFKEGNNDPVNAFVWESMGAREMILIPGTCLHILFSPRVLVSEV